MKGFVCQYTSCVCTHYSKEHLIRTNLRWQTPPRTAILMNKGKGFFGAALLMSWPEIRDMPYAHAQNKKNMAGEINSELLRIFHEN